MSSSRRRVVITGIGVVSPLGSTKEELWEAIAAGRSGVRTMARFADDTFPMHYGAAADQFRGVIDDFGTLEKTQKKTIRKGLKVMCRECLMGVAAAQRALNDAGLAFGQCDPERSGVNFGTDYMLTMPEEFVDGIRQCLDDEGQFSFSRWAVDGMPQMSPLWLLKYLPNMPASHIAIFNDFRGPNNSLTLREAAANLSVGESFSIISDGRADVMLVGATGTRIHPMKAIHAIQQEELASVNGDPTAVCRPFDRDRTGMVLGEGAGVVILEELSAATARGATILGEVLGDASSCVVEPNSLARRDLAMKNTLAKLVTSHGVSADEVGHIHAHGLSTRSCDIEEAWAINQVFGERATPVPVTAAKSYFGNLGAGSGIVELIASLMAMANDRLLPILNYENPDPDCPVAAVTDAAASPGRTFINLSVTPQGQASAVLVGRLE